MLIQIQWTCETEEEARAIVRKLIEKKLVACANIIPDVESMYRWDGKIESASEVKVYMKTIEDNYNRVKEVIEHECSYDVPEIIAFEISRVNDSYKEWINMLL